MRAVFLRLSMVEPPLIVCTQRVDLKKGIKKKVYFKRYKWYRLKTRRVCKRQTRPLYAVSQLRLRNGAMQQFPKLTFCSTVAF